MEASQLIAADAALPAQGGLGDEDARFLEAWMRSGLTWAQATAKLLAGLPLKLQPTAASLAAWQATITARAALPAYSPVDG